MESCQVPTELNKTRELAFWSLGPCNIDRVPLLMYSSKRDNARPRPVQRCPSKTLGTE